MLSGVYLHSWRYVKCCIFSQLTLCSVLYIFTADDMVSAVHFHSWRYVECCIFSQLTLCWVLYIFTADVVLNVVYFYTADVVLSKWSIFSQLTLCWVVYIFTAGVVLSGLCLYSWCCVESRIFSHSWRCVEWSIFSRLTLCRVLYTVFSHSWRYCRGVQTEASGWDETVTEAMGGWAGEAPKGFTSERWRWRTRRYTVLHEELQKERCADQTSIQTKVRHQYIMCVITLLLVQL